LDCPGDSRYRILSGNPLEEESVRKEPPMPGRKRKTPAGREAAMRVLIKHDSLDLLFRLALSCRCPFTDEEEQAIFHRLSELKKTKTMDYADLLKAFPSGADNIFHRLGQFCSWFFPFDSLKYVIERENVLRYFASSHHWSGVVERNLQDSYKMVRSVPKWFIGHMLLPVTLERADGGRIDGSFRFEGGCIRLSNLFLPPDFAGSKSDTFGVHFASVVSPLSQKESVLVRKLLDANPLFVEFRKDIVEIDYLSYERFGNLSALSRDRYTRHFG
jgi:hypothetical protein